MCVLFTGSEAKRVEIGDRGRAVPGMAWDSCNGPMVANPTPVAGGYSEFSNDGVGPRELSIRALHSGGVTCYMSHGPARIPFAHEPEIRRFATEETLDTMTLRFEIATGDAIELVLVVAAGDDGRDGRARGHAEAVAAQLLRERITDAGWRAVA